ncbi:MAG: hypothetical protein ACK502_02290 [Alphaproteobacteria bacterium]
MSYVLDAYAKIGIQAEKNRQLSAGERINVPDFKAEKRADKVK